MTKQIYIFGAALGDDMFTTDAMIFGEEISWNVTRLRAACNRGEFGQAEELSIDILPPMSSLAQANVDWQKVHRMIQAHLYPGAADHDVLDEPAINVGVVIGDILYRIPVDGNHRICARRVAGMKTWLTFIVPPEREREFRIIERRL